MGGGGAGGGGGGAGLAGGGVVYVTGGVYEYSDDEYEDESVLEEPPSKAYSPWKYRQMAGSCGVRHSSGRVVASAADMNSFQIVAGKVPPATRIPCTLSISI